MKEERERDKEIERKRKAFGMRKDLEKKLRKKE